MTISGNYEKDLLNGNWEEFYESGKKKVKGAFVRGQKSGKWLYYDANGKIIETKKFELNPQQASW